ncbi:efflux RND transporter permease subunit [Desulfovibrio sp. OttesenSCG-928-M14]|nr:efflux RND transporter permease subunit [Desulfovibrio sp. OttesenSCG-928-M14]
MSRFFIDRPIFAWVLAILVMMAGSAALFTLPVAQYPEIASPQVTVTARYPGASAKTVEETVTQVIEQQISGIDKLLYMSSNSDSNGQATITFTFENGANVDIAHVQVQNKLQLATPMLPDEVQRQGISVTKSSVGVLLITGFYSEDGSMATADLGDYVGGTLKDTLSRLPGVGSINFNGAQYAMRIWCDPEKFQQYRLNPSDVVAAVRAQNSQTTGGQVGAYPSLDGQQINITVNASSRLTEVAEFEDILLRTNPDGSQLRLRDVARVELNAETFNTLVKYNGNPAIALQFLLASGANALDTAKGIKDKLGAMSHFFPPGLKYIHTYDTTPFVEISIKAVFKTLGEAIVLVFLVMYLFLQSWRATFIPTIAIPVVLLGTFGVMMAAGFSINTLTMFGMVLSIGLLVDDAIVVVENVERLMRDEGLDPKEAAQKSMDQITGALVGVAAVIAAVFVPMAFMPGSVGIIYRQFSLTIVTSMFLSALVALSLTPALCATLLRPHGHDRREWRFFSLFNGWFDRQSGSHKEQVSKLLSRPVRGLAILGMGILVIGFLYQRLPSSFLPNEDQGAMYIIVQLPPGASLVRTRAVLDTVEKHLLTKEEKAVLHVMTMAGSSFIGSGHNLGQAFVSLRHWDERKSDDLQVEAIYARVRRALMGMPDARVTVFGPAPVKEMARAAGFEFELMDVAGRGHEALMEARDILLAMAAKSPLLRNVRHGGLEDVEQYELRIDLDKAGALSLDKGVINDTVAAYWGSVYVNDFMDRGRTKKVYLQADVPFRMQGSDFDRYYVRNARGAMVPFASFLTVKSTTGSPQLERYEGVSAVKIQGEATPGHSSGEAMKAMEALAAELAADHADGFGYLWTGMSFQEQQSGALAGLLYTISLAVVFLCLAALYESWTIPLSVLMAAPTGVIGALAGVSALGMSNDVYFQIGVLAVVGLSAKNSILIVEFARELHASGLDLYAATMQAARLRLRPIIMTSLAFTLGVLPLALNSGAGSGAQNAVGATVVCGVLSATMLGIYCTPLCFVVIGKLFSRQRINSGKKVMMPGQ